MPGSFGFVNSKICSNTLCFSNLNKKIRNIFNWIHVWIILEPLKDLNSHNLVNKRLVSLMDPTVLRRMRVFSGAKAGEIQKGNFRVKEKEYTSNYNLPWRFKKTIRLFPTPFIHLTLNNWAVAIGCCHAGLINFGAI